MVMVFTLVSAAQEWLGNLSDELKNQKDEVERKKKELEEEAERVRLSILLKQIMQRRMEPSETV